MKLMWIGKKGDGDLSDNFLIQKTGRDGNKILLLNTNHFVYLRERKILGTICIVSGCSADRRYS